MKDWVTPSNWHRTFDDIVRGTLVLRYIDGPSFLSTWLTNLAETQGIAVRIEPRALDDGYYAYHFYVQLSVELLRNDWSKFKAAVWIELQLTTQLQELARDLSHGFYEQRRTQAGRSQGWKWEYTSPRFKAAYISHSLHLIEGMIVELRDYLGSTPDATPAVATGEDAALSPVGSKQSPSGSTSDEPSPAKDPSSDGIP